MHSVFNDPQALQQTQTMLDLLKQSGNNERENLLSLIEAAKSSGSLEPENYDQLISSEYLGNEFQQAHTETYNQDIEKMQQFLAELEKRLTEYLKVS
jgi:hypothetical protein